MYKWDAAEYHKSSSVQQKWGQELILKLKLSGNERVLDIGCGEGKVTAELAEKVPNGSVLGIDNSEEQISFARKNYPPKKFANLAFELMDARNLSFNGEFDIVFSNAVLHWITDHLAVLKGIKKSLKPSGRILLQMAGTGHATELLAVMKTVTKSKRWSKYFQNFTFPWNLFGPKEYEDMLKQVGLRAKRVELIPKDMIFKGREGLSGTIRTAWLPWTQRVPEDLREEFIKCVVDKYVEKHPLDHEGLIHVAAIRLEVEAEN